jgi:hypothetical protein
MALGGTPAEKPFMWGMGSGGSPLKRLPRVMRERRRRRSAARGIVLESAGLRFEV